MEGEWVVFGGNKRTRRAGGRGRLLLVAPLLPGAAVFVYWTIAMFVGLGRYIARGGPDVRGDVVRDLPPGIYVVAGLLALIVSVALVSAVVLPFARRSHPVLWFYTFAVAVLACVAEIVDLLHAQAPIGWRPGHPVLAVYFLVLAVYLVVYALLWSAAARSARRRTRRQITVEPGHWAD